MKSLDLSLYLVTDRSLTYRSLSLGKPLEEIVEEAVKGGVTIVQLREKDCSTREFYDIAVRLKQCLKPYNVPLIINDRIDIALAADADGVHIGQIDMPYAITRKLIGRDKIIGLSVENVADAEEANQLDVDYIAVSPVFKTPTKIDTAPALGLEGLKEIVGLSKHPVVAIGGIHLDNASDMIDAGAKGVAVVSAIISNENPMTAAQELKKKIIRR